MYLLVIRHLDTQSTIANSSDAQLLADGRRACTALAKHPKSMDVLESQVEQPGWTSTDALAVITTAADANDYGICPEQQSTLMALVTGPVKGDT